MYLYRKYLKMEKCQNYKCFLLLEVTMLLFFLGSVSAYSLANEGHSRSKRQGIIFFGEPATPKPKSDCRTPQATPGNCMPLTRCKVLFDQLQNSPSAAVIANLRKSICRFEKSTPVICCPLDEETTTASTTSTSTTSTTTTSTTTTSTTTTTTPEPEPTTVAETTTAFTTTVEPTTTPTEAPQPTVPPKGKDLLPSEGVCGQTYTCRRTKIVSGRAIGLDEDCWPWIAALGFEDSRKRLEFLCGGALITNSHVVTAAHCVEGRDDLTTIRLGDLILDRTDDREHKDIRIAERIIHEEFNGRTYANDIAILKLAESVEFNATTAIRPVCLPTSDVWVNNSLAGFRPHVAGWGSIAYNNKSSDHLLEAGVKVVPQPECAAGYSRFKQVSIDESTLCAGDDDKDACQGDSGGPLTNVDIQGMETLIGVVSFGFRCAEPGYAGVYTRVTHYLDWIFSKLE